MACFFDKHAILCIEEIEVRIAPSTLLQKQHVVPEFKPITVVVCPVRIFLGLPIHRATFSYLVRAALQIPDSIYRQSSVN